jgi:hypothetical protein
MIGPLVFNAIPQFLALRKSEDWRAEMLGYFLQDSGAAYTANWSLI